MAINFHCSNCGKMVTANADGTCPNCGSHLADALPASGRRVTCPHCGAIMTPDSRGVCPNCHRPVSEGSYVYPPSYNPRPKMSAGQTIAIILFVLIGLPSCALGGCFLMFAQTGGPTGTNNDPTGMIVGLGGVLIFLILLILLILSSRKK